MTETVYIQHKPTKAEKEARRAEREAERQKELAVKIANLPDSVHGIPVVDTEYTAVSKKRVKELRHSFTKKRKAFLQHLAETQAPTLKALGISDKAVEDMLKGRSPNGYNVHHIQPLAGGGKNEFDNFVLIQNDPYHTDIHKVSDLQISKMNDGETKTIKLPVPKSGIFIPPEMQEKVQTALKQQTAISAALIQKRQQTR